MKCYGKIGFLVCLSLLNKHIIMIPMSANAILILFVAVPGAAFKWTTWPNTAFIWSVTFK